MQRHLVGGTIGWLATQTNSAANRVPASLKAKLDPDDRANSPTSRTAVTGNGHDNPYSRSSSGNYNPTRTTSAASSWSASHRQLDERNAAPASAYTSTIGNNSIGGGCSPLDRLFTHGPLKIGISGSGPSEYSLVSGTASDDVARITVYLGTGEVIPVALKDNVFVARVARAAYPLRIVAYDRTGRVISVTTSPTTA